MRLTDDTVAINNATGSAWTSPRTPPLAPGARGRSGTHGDRWHLPQFQRLGRPGKEVRLLLCSTSAPWGGASSSSATSDDCGGPGAAHWIPFQATTSHVAPGNPPCIDESPGLLPAHALLAVLHEEVCRVASKPQDSVRQTTTDRGSHRPVSRPEPRYGLIGGGAEDSGPEAAASWGGAATPMRAMAMSPAYSL